MFYQLQFVAELEHVSILQQIVHAKGNLRDTLLADIQKSSREKLIEK